MAQGNRKQGKLKDGTSRRARIGGRSRVPRIMWVALLVIGAGAVFLFWQPRNQVPTGIGERRSVVTVGADSAGALPDGPRSGDVELADEVATITPEEPEQPAEQATEPAPEPEPVAPEPAPRRETPPAPPVDPIVPAASGAWLIQVGSFGDSANADREAGRLRELGWDARVKGANRADGTMIYRVRVGFFNSRGDAEAFARQEKSEVPGAIAVHR